MKFERTLNHESHTLVCVLCWASTRYLKFIYFENVFFPLVMVIFVVVVVVVVVVY